MAFKKSSHCLEQYCVEVGIGSLVLVRDSKAPMRSPMLAFSPQAWNVFTSTLTAVRSAQRPVVAGH